MSPSQRHFGPTLALLVMAGATAQDAAPDPRTLRERLGQEFRNHRQWRVEDFLKRAAMVERAVESNRDVAPSWAANFCRSFGQSIARERPDDALPWLDRAIQIALAGGFDLQAAQHTLSKCEVLLEASRYDEALPELAEAGAIFAALPADNLDAQRGLVGTAMQSGRALLYTGRPDAALAALDRARDRVANIQTRTGAEAHGIAQVAINRGIALAHAGRFADALRDYERARRALADVDAPVMLAMVDSNIANLNNTIGRTAEARAHYERAGPLYRDAGRPLLYARTLTNLALTCLHTGDDEVAVTALDDAIPVFERAGDTARVAEAQLLRAQALARLGQTESAATAMATAREVFESHGRHQALGQLELNTAAACLTASDPTAAVRALDRAATQFELAGSVAESPLVHALRGEARRLADDAVGALTEFEHAASAVATATNAITPMGHDASRDLRERFAAIAPQATELAFRLRHDTPANSTALRQAYLVTQVLHGLGTAGIMARPSPPTATAVNRELEELRATLETRLQAAQRRGRELAGAPARTTAELRSRATAMTQAQAEVHRAALELARLRERARVAHTTSTPPRPTAAPLARVQGELDDSTALVEFVATEHGAYVFVITAHNARVVELLDPEHNAAVAALANVLARRQQPTWRELRSVGQRTLDPILATLPDPVSTLLIAPRGHYCRIPFELLLTSEPTGEASAQPYLARRFEVAYVPSGTALVAMRERPALAPTASRTFAGLGNPTGRGSNLARAGDEVVAIARLFATVEERSQLARESTPDELRGKRFVALLRDRATTTALRDPRVRSATIVHLACHAEADTVAPRLSRLLLAPGAGETDGALYFEELAELGLDCELLVLSSCASAVGPLSRVDGMIGLAAAGLAAGARAVISTLWPVADDDAARFMVLFYAELLKRDGDRIGALRAARLAAIEGGMPSRAWAAFVLFDGHRAE